MKIYPIIIKLILLCPFVSIANTGFIIKGKVTGIVSGTVWIEERAHENAQHATPAKVRIVNGEFVFTGKLDHPEMVKLHISTRQINVMLENTSYSIDEDFSKLGPSSLKGGTQHQQYVAFASSRMDPEAWIRQHAGQEFCGYMAELYFNTPYEKAVEIYNLLSADVKKTFHAEKLAAKIRSMEKSRAGKKAPAFTTTTPDGKKLTLKDLAGKIVVIDFWASWCGPCRAFIPRLKQYHELYNKRGVVFLSLSVDDSKEEWLKAVDEENMPWLQAISADGFKEDGMRKLFGFDSIPYLVVIGADGTIAASLSAYNKQNLQEELEKALQQQ